MIEFWLQILYMLSKFRDVFLSEILQIVVQDYNPLDFFIVTYLR